MFGTTDASLSDSYGEVITEVYVSVRDLYVASNNVDSDNDAQAKWVKFLKGITFDNDVCLGDIQNQANDLRAKDYDTYSSNFPTEEREGEMLPSRVPVKVESKEQLNTAVQKLQSMLKQHLAESDDNTGGFVFGQTDDSDGSNTEFSGDCMEALQELHGVGEKNVEKVKKTLENNPSVLEGILEGLETVESFEVTDEGPFADLNGEAKAKAQELRDDTDWSTSRIREFVA